MSPRTAVGLPPPLANRDNPVVRPSDAADVYTNPRVEFRRLADNGLLTPLAPGYFFVRPRGWIGKPWRPSLDDVALGIAQADYGNDVALCNASAARRHGAIARALATAAVAVPVQRPPLDVHGGRVYFSRRRFDGIDVQASRTDLVPGWVTTPEQTLLDLAARPTYGALERAQAEEAIRFLAARVEWARVDELAPPQRKVRAAAYARRFAGLS